MYSRKVDPFEHELTWREIHKKGTARWERRKKLILTSLDHQSVVKRAREAGPSFLDGKVCSVCGSRFEMNRVRVTCAFNKGYAVTHHLGDLETYRGKLAGRLDAAFFCSKIKRQILHGEISLRS